MIRWIRDNYEKALLGIVVALLLASAAGIALLRRTIGSDEELAGLFARSRGAAAVAETDLFRVAEQLIMTPQRVDFGTEPLFGPSVADRLVVLTNWPVSCPVHGTKEIAVGQGSVWDQYWLEYNEAERHLFPCSEAHFCPGFAPGGDERIVVVRYCTRCSEARAAWLREHGHRNPNRPPEDSDARALPPQAEGV